MASGIVLAIIVAGVISGALASDIASSKGWDGGNWFILGFLFGPLALIAIAGKADKKVQILLKALSNDPGPKPTGRSEYIDPIETLLNNEFLCGELIDKDELWKLILSRLDSQRASAAILEQSSFYKSSVTIRNSSGDQIARATAQALDDGRRKWKVMI